MRLLVLKDLQSKGIFPPKPETQEDEGELRTLTQLVLDACEVCQFRRPHVISNLTIRRNYYPPYPRSSWTRLHPT